MQYVDKMRGESEGWLLGAIITIIGNMISVTEPTLEGTQVASAHIYMSVSQPHGDS